MILADRIHKIVWVMAHKCGISTISTFLMNIYAGTEQYPPGRYVDDLQRDGMCGFREEYTGYFRILIIRNPYQRFVSGFLEDVSNIPCYKNMDMTFYEFCRCLAGLEQSTACRLAYDLSQSGHLQTMRREIGHELESFGYRFDRVILTSGITDLISEIRQHFGIAIQGYISNVKPYTEEDVPDPKLVMLGDFYRKHPYPAYHHFYNDEIREIVETVYREDFDLLERFGVAVSPPVYAPDTDRSAEWESVAVPSGKPSFCILVVPHVLNSYLLDRTLNSVRFSLCDIVIVLDAFLWKKYGGRHYPGVTFVLEERGFTIFDRQIVRVYLDLYKDRYSHVILYRALPVFIGDLDPGRLRSDLGAGMTRLDFENENWYFTREITPGFFPEYHIMGYNGLCLRSETFLRLFREILSVVENMDGRLPVLELLIPTVLKNRSGYDLTDACFLDQNMYRADTLCSHVISRTDV